MDKLSFKFTIIVKNVEQAKEVSDKFHSFLHTIWERGYETEDIVWGVKE